MHPNQQTLKAFDKAFAGLDAARLLRLIAPWRLP